jgi:hypothetical protein
LSRTSRSLYERANGYNYDAVKIFMPAGAKQPVVVHYVEHMPPDVTAGVDIRAGEDPRSRIVTATKKGRSVAMAAQAAWRKAQKAATAAIGKDGVEALHALARNV